MADAAPAASSAAPTTSSAPTSTGAAPVTAPPPAADGGSVSTPAPAPAAPKTWAVKYGDRTETLTEEQILHRAQKAYGAEQAFREAADIKKERAEFREALKDPVKAREYIRKHGGDPDVLLKKWALDWHQQQEMTPEQKENAAERQRAETAEAKLKAIEAEQANAAFRRDEEAAHGRLVEKFSAVLAKVSGPDVKPENVSPRLVMAMAQYEMANRVSGQGAPPEVVAAEVLETALGDGLAALDTFKSNPAEYVKRLGPERVALVINEVVRQEDERAGVQRPAQSRPVLVGGNGHDKSRNPDGTFKPSGRESREQASFNRFISGGGV